MRNIFKSMSDWWFGKEEIDDPNITQYTTLPVRITLSENNQDNYIVLCRNGDLDIIGISAEDYLSEFQEIEFSTSHNAMNLFFMWNFYREVLKISNWSLTPPQK